MKSPKRAMLEAYAASLTPEEIRALLPELLERALIALGPETMRRELVGWVMLQGASVSMGPLLERRE